MRSAFDKLISATGLVLVGVLLVAGGLLLWAHNFIGDQVNNQLTMQGITMPEGDALTASPRPTRRPSSSTPAARWTPVPRPRRSRTTTSSPT